MARAEQHPEWLQRAMAVRDQVAAAAVNLNGAEVTRVSGGVTLTLSAHGELRAIRIDPVALSRAADLERHILTAHQEAHQEAKRLTMGLMAPLRGMITEANLPLGQDT